MRRSENPGMSSLGQRQLKTLLYPLQNIQNISTTSSTVPLFQLHFIPRRKQSHWTESPFVQQPAIPKTIIHSSRSDCRPVHGAGSAGVLFFLASLRISNPKTQLDARVCEFSEQQLCFQAVGTNGLSFQGDMFWTVGVLE